jgi:hypothetical protein
MAKQKKVEVVEQEFPKFPYLKQMDGHVVTVVEELADGQLLGADGCTYKV